LEKARELTDFLRICFAHPGMEGFFFWGFWEGANWIPQSSLYRRDWTPTPAALAYRELVFNQWWTKWEGKADKNGMCELRGFCGDYEITVNYHGKITKQHCSLTNNRKMIEVKL
jgi:endo-1,4-beta-xylanase